MIRRGKFFSIMTVLLLFLVSRPASVQAVSDQTEKEIIDNASGFSYQVVHPDNQVSDAGFFDLRVTPSQRQTIEIKLKNLGDDTLKVNVELNGSRTNPNGVIEFGPNDLKKDKSMPVDFKDVVKGPAQVEVPGKSEVPLKLDIAMPAKSFDGIIAGGIQLSLVKDEAPSPVEGSGGTRIINEFVYTVSLVLSETDQQLVPELTLIKIRAAQLNYRNAVIIDLGNPVASILSELSIKAQIMAKNSDKVLYEAQQTKMRMAPNSILNFVVKMNDAPMVAGHYQAQVSASSGSKKWEWNEDFEITRKEAANFNEQAVGIDEQVGDRWKIMALVTAAVVLLASIIYVCLKNYRKKKERPRNSKKKKRQASTRTK